MEHIQLNDGNSIEIIETLQSYDSNQLYYKVQLENKELRILPEADFNALAKTDKGNYSEEEKLSLFHSYFRGRPDVYAIKYYSKNGKTGYTPHGDFKWIEVADNKRINGTKWKKEMISFYPYTKETIKKHIIGSHNDFKYGAGIYPMLTDDTCYLLVMDFDNDNADQEAKVITQVADEYDIPILIERSQSGRGIHIWFFFEEPISAKSARKLGSSLIQAAMMKSGYIKLENFDRMIPMQDTLNQNGFGNLIALPLRWQKVQDGRTVFLKPDFSVAKNQWTHLAGIKKLAKDEVLNKIDELDSTDYLFKGNETIDSLSVRLGGEIKIEKNSITRSEFMQIAFMATFGNPEFTIRQNMRATTWNTPRYITGANEDDEFLYIPRGLLGQMEDKVKHLDVKDELSDGQSVEVEFKGILRDDQLKAVEAMMSNSIGILSASTGFGKTIVAADLIARRKVTTLVIVNNKVLANQWKERLNKFLDIRTEPFIEYTPTGRKRKKDKIGEIHGTKNNQSKVIDIALFQSLSNKKDLKKFLNDYGLIIIDEAHHIAAESFESVIKEASSRYLYGLSATPERKDGYTPLIKMRLGEIIYEHHETQADTILLPQYFYPRFTNYAEISQEASYTSHLAEMSNHIERNEQVIEDIIENLKLKRTCLVLSERVEHVHQLYKLLKEKQIEEPMFILTSKEGQKMNQENIAVMKELQEPYILLATSSYVGEGFDLPQLDTIFLTLPFSWKGRLRQYLGRLQREVGNKDELRVYDYIDLGISMFDNMYQKRLREYKKLGYMMAEDEKTKSLEAGLYDSTNYYGDLRKDFNDAGSITLCIKSLTAELVKVVYELIAEGKEIQIITQQATAKNGKVNHRQKAHFDELKHQNIEVEAVEKVTQSFIVLDMQVAWYGSLNFYGSMNDGASTIRLKNAKLAKQIMRHK